MIYSKPIIFGNGGEYASIVVSAPTGSTVTCTTPTGIILTTSEISGTWTFGKLNESGTYIIESSIGVRSSVLIDAGISYAVSHNFTRANYIQGTGTQCCTTGIYPSLNTVTKFGIMMSENTGDSIIGHREANGGDDGCDYRIFNYSGNIYFDAGTSRLNGSAMSIGTYYDIEFGNNYVKRNGTTVLSGSTLSSLNNADKAPINVFAFTSKGASICKGKLYYLQIIQNNNIVFDAKPYYDTSGRGLLIDSISHKAIYSLTSTHFLYG